MTKIIGLTGGIGSGKTTVANYFKSLGIPVYIADEAGKKILTIPKYIKMVREIFGEAIVSEDTIDRKKLAELVFNDPLKLSQLNSVIHPAVRDDFQNWLSAHNEFPMIIKEAAILFESGSYKECDAIITVIAPRQLRIKRVMDRDKATELQVIERMNQQWTDDQRAELSDHIIVNDELSNTHRQVREILKKLKNI